LINVEDVRKRIGYHIHIIPIQPTLI